MLLTAILIASEIFNPPLYTNYEQSDINTAGDKICGIVSTWSRIDCVEVAMFIRSVSSLDRDNQGYDPRRRNPIDEQIVREDANRIIYRFNTTCHLKLTSFN
jgi:hypothetical protein